jgi:hypothetical protein
LLGIGAVGAAIEAHADRIGQLAADIGIDAIEVVGPIRGRGRAIERLVERELAGHRHETAGARLAIERGGGPLDHLDGIEARHVDLRRGIARGAGELLQPVEIDRRIEAAQLELVVDFGAGPARFGVTPAT